MRCRNAALLLWWAVVGLSCFNFDVEGAPVEDSSILLLDSTGRDEAVPASILKAVHRIKGDRARAKRREAITKDVKKATIEEKRASKKNQHKEQRAIRKENKKERKDEQKRAAKSYKKVVKKSEASKPAKGKRKKWASVVKDGVITAKELAPKTKERNHVYNHYTSVVNTKKKKEKKQKPVKRKHKNPAPASHCAECKSKCRTQACRSWCGMRWCAKTTMMSTNKTPPRSQSASKLVCADCHKVGPSNALQQWCKAHDC